MSLQNPSIGFFSFLFIKLCIILGIQRLHAPLLPSGNEKEGSDEGRLDTFCQALPPHLALFSMGHQLLSLQHDKGVIPPRTHLII